MTTKEHFLTFILPCYNYADVIEEALKSVYQQCNLSIPFEVICTDDHSADERTRKILGEWEGKKNNFHVYYHPETKGECAANNTSISLSKGDLIFCLDTDNILVPNSVEKLVELHNKTGCEGACFEELRFFLDDKKHISSWFFKAPNNVCDIYHIISGVNSPAASGNYLFTRESYNRAGGYPEGNVMGSWSFGFRQFATGSKIHILPNSFYWHRYSEGGMFLKNQRTGANKSAIMRTVLEFPEIYTEETWKFMQTDECKSDFLDCCRKGRIKIKHVQKRY